MSFYENRTDAENILQQALTRLREAEQLHRHEKFDQARAICESIIRSHPNYVGALYRLGLIYADQNNNEHALDCLVRAAMLDPRDGPVLMALGEIYLRLGANEMARRTLEQAMVIGPADAKALLALGDIYQEDCEYELARDIYRQALTIDPDLTPAAIGLGWCLYHLGEHTDAAKVFERLVDRGVRLLEPVRALAILPASAIDLLAQIDKVVKEPHEDQNEFEISLEFLRAVALDRLGKHAGAWSHFSRANRRAFAGMQNRMGQISERWRTSIELLHARPKMTHRSEDPQYPISLFVMGPSRSGKTVAERLAGRLGGVKRGYENSIVRDAVARTFQASSLLTSNSLELLPPHLHSLCREYYLDDLARKTSPAQVFTNTTPGHIHIAALIAEVFPNARFIFVKRNLEDNLLRIFMARYRGGNAYAYDLKAARDHILQYHQMMDLMANKYSDIARVVSYEDMIARPAAFQSVVAELCGLRAPDGPPPVLIDDTGCSAPYREFIKAETRC